MARELRRHIAYCAGAQERYHYITDLTADDVLSLIAFFHPRVEDLNGQKSDGLAQNIKTENDLKRAQEVCWQSCDNETLNERLVDAEWMVLLFLFNFRKEVTQ